MKEIQEKVSKIDALEILIKTRQVPIHKETPLLASDKPSYAKITNRQNQSPVDGKQRVATKSAGASSSPNAKEDSPVKKTKSESDDSSAERKKYLHVWRLNKDTTVENMEKFISGVCKEQGEQIKIEKIKHKLERDYASFIIGVPASSYDKLCSSEIWPVNVEYKTGLNDSIFDAEIVPPGFQVLRCDRTDGRKQGGALLVATPRIELRRVTHGVNLDDRAFELVCATGNNVPNCDGRQLDLVLSGESVRGSVSVCAACDDESLQPIDIYHPPLAVSVAATVPTLAACAAGAVDDNWAPRDHCTMSHNNQLSLDVPAELDCVAADAAAGVSSARVHIESMDVSEVQQALARLP
ncbi:hypothetical protein MSG28_005910, partial [Choristoneura fumiferana]